MLKENPYYTYQIDAIESWLDEQAQKGLFLDDCVGTLFSFVKGEPKTLRYRVDLRHNLSYNDAQSRIADYRELGWEYVCELNWNADIYVCHDPDTVELNTDEQTLHQVLDVLLKREIGMGIAGTIILPLLWLHNLWPRQNGYDGVYDNIVNGFSPFFALLTVLLILSWTIPMVLHLWDAVQTRRRLLLTRDYHTDSRAKKRRTLNRAVFATLILILLSVGILWAYTRNDTAITAEEFGPAVTVLFPGHEAASFIPYSDDIPDETLWKDSMPLIRSARARQYGYEQLDPNDAFNQRPLWIYNADLETVHISWLAEKYAAEKAEALDMKPITFPGWENAWFVERTDSREGQDIFAQEVLLQDGKDVWWFGYWTYDEAPQYGLLEAVKAYSQSHRTDTALTAP